jgi:multiple sugar transport system substrate-binding protein
MSALSRRHFLASGAAGIAGVVAGRAPAYAQGTRYIVVDMFAKALQGMKAEDAVGWAAGELKKIYDA